MDASHSVLDTLLAALRSRPQDPASIEALAGWIDEQGGPRRLVEWRRWDAVEALFTTLSFLERGAVSGNVFELATALANAVDAMPPNRPMRSMLGLLAQGLLRDAHFIHRHPTALFQCLWNTCWWHDSPMALAERDPFHARGGSVATRLARCLWLTRTSWRRLVAALRPGPRLSRLLESWRAVVEARSPAVPWLRSLRPPSFPLGGAQQAVIPVDIDRWRVAGLAFSRDGACIRAWLAPPGRRPIADEGMVTRVWRADDGREVASAPGCDVPFESAPTSTDGRWQLTRGEGSHPGGWGAPIALRDTARRVAVEMPVPEESNLCGMAISPDGGFGVAGGYGDEWVGVAYAWELASQRLLASVTPSASVWAVACSPDGAQFATAGSDGAVQVWETHGGRLLATLHGHEGLASAVAFAPNGRGLASAAADGTIRTWRLDRYAERRRRIVHRDHIVDCVYSSDGRRLVTRTENSTTWLWNATTGEAVACLHQSDGVVLLGGSAHGCVHADRRRVRSVGFDGGTWDADTGATLGPSPVGPYFSSSEIRFTFDGRRCAGASTRHLVLDVFADVPRIFGPFSADVSALAWSSRGDSCACALDDGTVLVFDVEKGTQVARLVGHRGRVVCLAYSWDGHQLASGATDETVRTWSLDAATEVRCWRDFGAGTWGTSWSRAEGERTYRSALALAYARDGSVLWVRPSPDVVEAWSMRDGEGRVHAFAGRTDLAALAAGAPWPAFVRGREVVVERGTSGEVVARLPCPLAPVHGFSLVAHPDMRRWAGFVGPHLYGFALETGAR